LCGIIHIYQTRLNSHLNGSSTVIAVYIATGQFVHSEGHAFLPTLESKIHSGG
jgi:hypothetical protein